MGVTQELSAYAAALRPDRLPPDVVARARLLVLDLAGSIIRARHDIESTAPLLAATRALGLASGNATVFGDQARYTPAGAALLNGALGHSLDFDDTHATASIHPGAAVIPAALAAGEMVGASGSIVLTGIVAGYEIMSRIALALPAGEHYRRGFHPTGTCGAFGAATAAARVFGLDASGIAHALGIALSQSAGSMQFLANGAWSKRFHVGWVSMAGLTAASLAREGFTGASEAIEGRHGFLNAYAPAPLPERALHGLGAGYELLQVATKPYPSCRFGHAAIDAALALRSEHAWPPDAIEAVTIGLSQAGMALIGDPRAAKANPRTVLEAQFSAPFVVGTALLTGAMDWDSYAGLTNPSLRALLPRITTRLDPEVEAEYPANMAGRVTIVAQGQTVQHLVTIPLGEPGNPMSDSAIRTKFAALASPILGQAGVHALEEALLSLDTLPNLSGLMRRAMPASTTRIASD